eukprot:12817426-Alexandrium_andersonii.AAC.1
MHMLSTLWHVALLASFEIEGSRAVSRTALQHSSRSQSIASRWAQHLGSLQAVSRLGCMARLLQPLSFCSRVALCGSGSG